MTEIGTRAGSLKGEPFHVGVVVSNIEEGMRQYAGLLGVEWTTRIEMHVPVDLDGEPTELTFRFAFARNGPVRLEITEEIPGTLWAAGSGLNHIAYWSDDVVGETRMLEQAGCTRGAAIFASRGEPPISTMTLGPQGMYIELISSSRRAGIERLWTS